MRRSRYIAAGLLLVVCCLLGGCLSPPAPESAGNSQLRFYTEEFPPYNYLDPGGSVNGSSTEVITEIMHRLGQKDTIELIPWSEGYNRTLSTPDTALFSTARTAERENLFSWVGPIGSVDYVFYARNGSTIAATSLEAIKKSGTVAVVRDDARYQYLISQNVTDLALYPDDESCLRALMANDVAFWLGSSASAPQIISSAGYKPGDVVPLYTASGTELFIAFNNQTSPEIISAWQNSLDGMKRDGTFAAIMALYGLPVSPSAAGEAGGSGQIVLPAVMALADQSLSCLAASLDGLALTTEAKSGDWSQIRPLLLNLEEHTTGARLWYALPDGSYYTTVDNLTTATLADRPYFPGVLAGNISIGSVVVSHSTGRTTGIVAVPIKDDGRVTGVLGGSVYLDTLSDYLADTLRLPANMSFFALDQNGSFALNSQTNRIGQQPAIQGTPIETGAFRSILTNETGEISYVSGGMEHAVIFDTSPLTGWKFGVDVTQ
jgi:ABC-type amino acid transport substrate-binding protein